MPSPSEQPDDTAHSNTYGEKTMTQGPRPSTREQVQGCLAGLAIGDALGMPVEIMTRKEILEATDGKGVEGFLAPIQRKIKDTRGLAPGMTTDDTQLAFAVAHGLLEYHGVNRIVQARKLLDAYRDSAFGWGGTTTRAVKDFALYYTSHGKEGRHPEAPAPEPDTGTKKNGGCGNGVAMRIAPMAIWHALKNGLEPEPFITDVIEHGLQTHGDPRASFAALAIAGTIRWLLVNGPESECLCRLIQHTLDLVEIVESRYRFYRRSDDTLSTRLHMAFGTMFEVEELESVTGAGCFALESIPFSIAMFHRSPMDFRKGVLEAVNAGGDTDTTAAMVGAMIGAHVGIQGIPQEWIKKVPDCRDAIRLADTICATADPLTHGDPLVSW